MNNKRQTNWIIAGVINLLTALLHTVGGQIDLVNPLVKSNLTDQSKAEWIGGWHMITITLFTTAILLIKNGVSSDKNELPVIKYVGYLYILFSFPSIITSVSYNLLAPQWILLLPIGILSLLGYQKVKNSVLITN